MRKTWALLTVLCFLSLMGLKGADAFFSCEMTTGSFMVQAFHACCAPDACVCHVSQFPATSAVLGDVAASQPSQGVFAGEAFDRKSSQGPLPHHSKEISTTDSQKEKSNPPENLYDLYSKYRI